MGKLDTAAADSVTRGCRSAFESRRQPPHHLYRAALVDGQAHQLALRIEHHPSWWIVITAAPRKSLRTKNLEVDDAHVVARSALDPTAAARTSCEDQLPNDVQVDVGKRKRRLTAEEKATPKRRKAEFQTVFIHGKMKRVRRPPTIDGMNVDEFIRRNADPVFLHEMEMWWRIEQPDSSGAADEMRDEYDFSGGVRGKYAARYPALTMIVQPDGEGFVSFCAELDVWSQGSTAEEARANLAEALGLFLETADENEIRRRLGRER